MLPVAELPFAPERQVLDQIELQIVRQQRRQRGPDHDMQRQHDREASAGLAARIVDQDREPRRRRMATSVMPCPFSRISATAAMPRNMLYIASPSE